jgi:hypothetical protein
MGETQSLLDLGRIWSLNERERRERTQLWSKQGLPEFSKLLLLVINGRSHIDLYHISPWLFH